nr:hypothetical protein CFP56_21274 [Quercus suber]
MWLGDRTCSLDGTYRDNEIVVHGSPCGNIRMDIRNALFTLWMKNIPRMLLRTNAVFTVKIDECISSWQDTPQTIIESLSVYVVGRDRLGLRTASLGGQSPEHKYIVHFSTRYTRLVQAITMATAVEGSLGADNDGVDSALVKNIVILSWALCTLLWSIFTPPHRTFAARNLLFQPLWPLRVWRKDFTWLQDLALFEMAHFVYTYCTGAWTLPTKTSLGLLNVSDHTLQMYAQVFTLLGVCAVWAGAIVLRGKQIGSSHDTPGELHEQRIDEQVLPPLLLTSRTDHARLIPKKHSFSYSYLLVGIPVGIQGRISTVLSVDSQKRGWFSVNSAGHLERDEGRSGLAAKLKRYLHTQGVTDRDYAFAYLVTAPCFAGYNFNPVSFWYLYDSDTHLKYMVLEVNNTFDERRMYLLKGDRPKPPADALNGDNDSKSLVFSEVWEKDFHVSPFNSRKGTYSLKALDPLAHYEETGQVRIDNTIVLRSSKESSKIVARVYSEGRPRDPATISTAELAKFIAAWWWVGFATFPRIVWEASKLFFQRKLHVWYRPEVAATSLGRAYSADERLLESLFRAFLTQTVADSSKPLRVIYEPAHSGGRETVMYSPGFTYEEDHQRTLTLKVLSPAFFSRFVHYAHAKEAFDRECLATDDKNRTLAIERPELLPILLDAMHAQHRQSASSKPAVSLLETLRWSWLRRLRCPPAPASYPTIPPTAHHVSDIRVFRSSELDVYVLRHQRADDASLYRRAASKLFLAERVALGLPPLLVALDRLIRVALLVASMLYSDRCHAVDILRPRKWDNRDLRTVGITLALANAVHAWTFVKG